MTLIDLLSDTTYPQQAVKQLHQLLSNNDKFPVKPTQIYGLRQIAKQQPGRVRTFAEHQRDRARNENENEFWSLVLDLCRNDSPCWSVPEEGHHYLPEELRDHNLREVPGATPQETQQNQRHNNRLKRERAQWLEQWENEHIPAFFERFCTHCLYRIAKLEMGQPADEDTNEAHQQSQQEQNETQDGTMQNALQQANLIE